MTLMEAFAILPKPRSGPAQRHDFREMILVALCAVLCGANTWVDVAEWSEDHFDWLRKYIPAKEGAPSHDTFGRVFRLLDATVFEQCFRARVAGLVGVIARVVAFDGKTLRGSHDGHNTALHMVSAYLTCRGWTRPYEHTGRNSRALAWSSGRSTSVRVFRCAGPAVRPARGW